MHKVPWWRTSLGPEEAQRLVHSISREHISQGPVTAEFESQLAAALGVPYAVATTNGSIALLMALMAVGVGRDDEVIVPNRTFVATAHAALLLGAKVVLVDTRPNIPTMDAAQVRSKITARTKAIMPVHLNGRAVDLTEVRNIAKEYGLYVIEDAAQALFSRNAFGFLGTQSDAGCFSLGMTKLITTGQGGVVVTQSAEMYERLKLIRNHGVVDTLNDAYTQMGFNFKFNDLLASIGIVQLSRAQTRVSQVNAVYAKYAAALSEFPFLKLIPVAVEDGEVPLWVEVLCAERAALIEFLSSQGVETRKFLPDLNLSPHLRNGGDFRHSKVFSEQGMFLPCGPEQPLENIDYTIEALRRYAQSR